MWATRLSDAQICWGEATKQSTGSCAECGEMMRGQAIEDEVKE